MTRLAVLADIHGNADALSVVLVDILDQAPDAVVNLGDRFSGPLDAARTAHLLAGANLTAPVRGNHDRWLSDPNAMDAWDKRIVDRHGSNWTVSHRPAPCDTTSAVARACDAGSPDREQALATGWII